MKKVLKFLGVILRYFGIVFCGIGVIVYTVLLFTEDPELRPVFIVLDVILCLFLLLLIFRKKRPKNNVSTRSNQSHHNAKRTGKRKTTPVLVEQGKDQLRIIRDCLSLIEKTKNLETFFNRYELGMQTALTLKQAGLTNDTENLPTALYNAFESQKLRVLDDSYWNQKEKIEKLSSPKTKAAHWKQYLELLKRYEDQYSLEYESDYQDIVDQVLVEISRSEHT